MVRRSIPFILALLGSGCATAEPAAPGLPVLFRCESGREFRVAERDRKVEIETVAGRFTLDPRPSSIGRKYSAGEATLILDGDLAALNGLPGGPFKRCRRLAEDGPERVW